MSRKRYTEEFKIEAVRQVTDRGYSVAEVAERPETRLRLAKMQGFLMYYSENPPGRRDFRKAVSEWREDLSYVTTTLCS